MPSMLWIRFRFEQKVMKNPILEESFEAYDIYIKERDGSQVLLKR